jgi:hypothetical protein
MVEVIDSSQPIVYQIRLRGHLSQQWADWFEELTITLEDNGDTLFTGPVADQAALYGLLKKVRDLGMPLLSVNCVEPVHSTAFGAGRAEADVKQKINQNELGGNA